MSFRVLVFALPLLLSAACSSWQLPAYLQLPRAAKVHSQYKAEVLVRGIPLRGIHGVAIYDDRLLVGSVAGASIYEVSRKRDDNNRWTVWQPAPHGMADDLEQGPDGTLVWTAFLDGRVYGLHPDADEPYVIAENLPGVNSLAFNEEGRLFVTRVFLADELYEMDAQGKQPPRLLMSGMGGLNGFDFGPDNLLYGPLWFKEKIVRLDPDAVPLELEDVASGFGIPAAVNFAPDGTLWAVDTKQGKLLSMAPPDDDDDSRSYGAPRLELQMLPALDNLAIDDGGEVYVTNMSNNSVTHYDPETGESDVLIESPLAAVGDLVAGVWQGRNVIYVADLFALRRVEASTGRVMVLARMFGSHIEYPTHLGINADHSYLVLTGWSSGKVQVYDLEKNQVIASRDAVTPHDADFLPDGRIVWLEYATGKLLIADAQLQHAEVAVENLITPSSLTVSPSGQVYVSEAVSGNVLLVDLQTGHTEVLMTDLNRPEGLALTPEGDLLIAEAGGDRLLLLRDAVAEDFYNRAQVLATGLQLDNLQTLANAPVTSLPVGVTVGGQGRIYLGSNAKATLYVLTADGCC